MTAGHLPTRLDLECRPGDAAWTVTLTWSGATPAAPVAEMTTAAGDAIPGVTLNAATAGQVVTLTITGTVPLGRHRWVMHDLGLSPLGGDFLATLTPRVGSSNTALTIGVGGGASVTVQAVGGVSDHGALTGLADDDHAQYLTSARHGAITGNPHGTTAAQVGADPAGSAATAQAVAIAASQPVDSDLTAIAALATTTYGRAFLALADAAAARTALALGTAATTAAADYEPSGSVATEAATRASADGLRLLKSGDTMTGDLTLAATGLYINSSAGGCFAWSAGVGYMNVYDVAGGFGTAQQWVSSASVDGRRWSGNSRADVGSTSDLGATLGIWGTSATRVTQIIRMAAGQTVNALQIQDSAGTALMSVTSGGRLKFDAADSAPANTTTPVGWTTVFHGGTARKMPLYA